MESTAASPWATAGTAAVATAATTLSSDSPEPEETDPQRRCQQLNPTFLQCEGLGVDIYEAAIWFLQYAHVRDPFGYLWAFRER